MDIEKIKLALALKDLEIVIIKVSTFYVGYLNKLYTSDDYGYKQPLLDENYNKIVKVGKSRDDVIKKLYERTLTNAIKK